MNYGFIPSVIDLDEHYILGDGSLSPAIIMPDGQWDDFLPVDDLQNKNGLETENCTNYGTEHIIGTLGNFKFNRDRNGVLLPMGQRSFQALFSERYTGVMTGTTIYGNDPHGVIEIIRTQSGLIPQLFLPFDSSITSWIKYYSPSPMGYTLYAIGKHWLKKYTLSHQWIVLPIDTIQQKQQKMKTALQYSPLGASVFAWNQHPDGLYYSDQPYKNHWIEVYGFVDGQYWKIFDSYDSTHKKLNWNFDFGQVKGYDINYNVGGDILGDTIKSVYFSYGTYLLGQYINSIMK